MTPVRNDDLVSEPPLARRRNHGCNTEIDAVQAHYRPVSSLNLGATTNTSLPYFM